MQSRYNFVILVFLRLSPYIDVQDEVNAHQYYSLSNIIDHDISLLLYVEAAGTANQYSNCTGSREATEQILKLIGLSQRN